MVGSGLGAGGAIDRAAAQWHSAHMERTPPMVNAVREAAVPARPRGARLLAAAAVAVLGLGACSYLPAGPNLPRLNEIWSSPSQVRGHFVQAEDLTQITPGVSTRNDVQAALGSPTSTSTFDDSEWFYIGSITRQRPAQVQAVDDQQVVVIRFDQGGTVREVRRLGQEDARRVRVVERITPSPGNERSLMQQLFGNIGRVGPGLGAQQAGQGPGAASPGGSR
jgi:outer membrane protein assembly factor BamE (lipoprotein component of BamABCDE complex)